ncbi:hypothetical protein HXX02_00090 [Microbulbifer elongatus]|uniref:Uncharacterized protein n=1 Tax=Microbulbifer elongatus TaxID=86173 RepID=A0ABT1NYQ5_9GAMM|nr:hypothetical protein [Microbulbifer elongatus]MCQ3827834.1 hypothetical protein [Microbulbifer elongatus]
MDPRALVVHLEKPYLSFEDSAQVKEILLAGLAWDPDYWPGLAVSWIEQGAPIDGEVRDALDAVAKKKHFPQPLRHKAFPFARKWEREHA